MSWERLYSGNSQDYFNDFKKGFYCKIKVNISQNLSKLSEYGSFCDSVSVTANQESAD